MHTRSAIVEFCRIQCLGDGKVVKFELRMRCYDYITVSGKLREEVVPTFTALHVLISPY
jgi:hypothetical protein